MQSVELAIRAPKTGRKRFRDVLTSMLMIKVLITILADLHSKVDNAGQESVRKGLSLKLCEHVLSQDLADVCNNDEDESDDEEDKRPGALLTPAHTQRVRPPARPPARPPTRPHGVTCCASGLWARAARAGGRASLGCSRTRTAALLAAPT